MLLLRWKIPPVGPCDALALDGVEDLSDAELAAPADAIPDDSPYDHAAAPVATRARFAGTGWRYHPPTPSIPALHLRA